MYINYKNYGVTSRGQLELSVLRRLSSHPIESHPRLKLFAYSGLFSKLSGQITLLGEFGGASGLFPFKANASRQLLSYVSSLCSLVLYVQF